MDFCPFTNKPCSNAKVIHVTDILNGEAQQMHLCQTCAKKYLDANPVKPIQKEDPLLEISKIIAKELVAKIEKSIFENYSENKCPRCGISEQEILNHGRFGCAICYEHFHPLVDKIIKKCQDGETKHMGKVPKQFQNHPTQAEMNLPYITNILDKIKILESKIKKAVEVENYEIAQILKNKIQELKNSMNHDS